jgi:DHA2 family methylenomycin A resistance protein-like MFS transporter
MEGGFTLACGTLGDLYGRKRILTLTTWLFVLATLGCALSPSAPVLIVMRGLQGLGGAALLSLPVAILVQMLPNPEDNEDAIKSFSMVAGLGAVAGPVIGGVLVHWFGWPAVFYLSVVMGLAVLGTFPSVTESDRDPSLRLDGVGQFLAILSFLAVSFALIEGNANGWASPIIIAAFAVFVAGLALFIVVERRVKQPMVHLKYFKLRLFDVSLLVIGVVNFGWYGIMLLCTLFLQNVQHQTPIQAGFYLMPSNIAFFIANQYSSQLETLIGKRAIVVLSFATSLAGIAWLAVLGVDSPSWEVSAGLFVAGIGWGLIFTPAAAMGMSAVTAADEGFASGAIALSRSLFGVFGIAVLGSLLAAGIAHATGSRVYHQTATTSLSPSGALAFVDGMHLAMIVCFALTLIFGVVTSTLTPSKNQALERASA